MRGLAKKFRYSVKCFTLVWIRWKTSESVETVKLL